jgi:hypothetical protein
MKYFFILIIFIFLTFICQADEFNNYLDYRTGLKEYKGDIKCATKYETQLRFLLNNSTEKLNAKLQLISLAPPIRTDSLITEHFTLHWNVSGNHSIPPEDMSSNGIPDYIDTAAVVLEHVWDVEIDQMNYSPPPQQNGQPTNNYHVYFSDLPYYGITTGSGIDIPALPGTNWTSYLELENDFQESIFFTQGLDGLRVTAAHEFHHAIQLGYNVRQEEFFFYEMTSTWLEDVLYNQVNDYYNYLPSLFNYLGNKSFNDFSLYAYGNCLYVHMIAKQYRQEIVKQIWDEIKSQSVIDAISNILMLPAYSSTWLKSLAQYGVWLYYTGDRSNFISYFSEAEYYPQYKISSSNSYQFYDSLEFENNIIQNSFIYYKINGVKDKAILSNLTSVNATRAGHQYITTTAISNFSEIGSILNNFVVNEDSVIAIITNAENYGENFKVNFKIMTNFVQIDSLIVHALPGRNMLTWSSFYESLLKEYRLNRKIQDGNFEVIQIINGNEFSNNRKDYSFIDENIDEGTNYYYKLDVEYLNGELEEIDIKTVNSLEPVKFALLQNNPNPFNNETLIIVELLNNTEVELIICNTLGQKVKTLQKRQNKPTGFYMYKWNGENDIGENVSSGIYYAFLKSRGETKNIKIVLVK